MEISDELYREIILDHYKNPRHFGKLENADVQQPGANPLCGDELELMVSVKDGVIVDIAFQGKGCSISQASASMMTDAVCNHKISEIQEMVAKFRGMMLENKGTDDFPEPLEDAKSLEGVKRYPVRVKCAVLAWNTLSEALKKIKG